MTSIRSLVSVGLGSGRLRPGSRIRARARSVPRSIECADNRGRDQGGGARSGSGSIVPTMELATIFVSVDTGRLR